MKALLLYFVTILAVVQQQYVVSLDSTTPTTSIQGRLYFPLINRTTNDFVPFNGTTTKITLNHGIDYTTYSRPDGSFTIRNIKPGVHVIDIHNVIYHFPQIKCQYKPENEPAVTCLEYVFTGAPKQAIEIPLKVFAIAEYEYFEIRKGFSMWGIVKNPMVLMMAFTVGMMFLMPKLMEGMDDEERARVQKQMEMQKDPTKMLGELWGSITGAEEEQPSPAKTIKGKKRQ